MRARSAPTREQKAYRSPRESIDSSRISVKVPLRTAHSPLRLTRKHPFCRFADADSIPVRVNARSTSAIKRPSVVHVAPGACITQRPFFRKIYSTDATPPRKQTMRLCIAKR
jgi:hypothetical protein